MAKVDGEFIMIKKRYIFAATILLLIISLLLLLSFGYILKYCSAETPRKTLPPDAKIIGEYNWGNLFPPDYCYYLKAEMSYGSFILYKDKMKFTLLPEEKYSIFDFGGFDNHTDSWWNPKDEPNQVYFNPSMKGSQKAFMKYENGFLYYRESAGL